MTAPRFARIVFIFLVLARVASADAVLIRVHPPTGDHPRSPTGFEVKIKPLHEGTGGKLYHVQIAFPDQIGKMVFGTGMFRLGSFTTYRFMSELKVSEPSSDGVRRAYFTLDESLLSEAVVTLVYGNPQGQTDTSDVFGLMLNEFPVEKP